MVKFWCFMVLFSTLRCNLWPHPCPKIWYFVLSNEVYYKRVMMNSFCQESTNFFISATFLPLNHSNFQLTPSWPLLWSQQKSKFMFPHKSWSFQLIWAFFRFFFPQITKQIAKIEDVLRIAKKSVKFQNFLIFYLPQLIIHHKKAFLAACRMQRHSPRSQYFRVFLSHCFPFSSSSHVFYPKPVLLSIIGIDIAN